MHILLLLKEFFDDIKKQKTRAFLTTIAITWGTLTVILLMAFGEGLSFRMQQGMLNAGDRIIRVYGGQTTKKFMGLPIGRRIRLVEDDAAMLKKSVPLISDVNAMIGKHIRIRKDDKISSTYMEGIYPAFEALRRMPPNPGGRFINDMDLVERRRVVFLGGELAKELFGVVDPIGQSVYIDGLPFKVIGTMPKKLQTSMNYGPDDRRAIIPYSTFESIYGYRYVQEIIIKPRTVDVSEKVIKQVREIMGRKYQFDPTDERALPMWDFIEQEKESAKVFLGINIFLAVIGVMTLIIAGVGVANIMYVVAKERTQEIGIKRAVGARKSHIIFQFIFESLLISFIGGILGLLLASGLIKLIWTIPVKEGATEFLLRPLMSGSVVILSISILTLIGLLAGLFPARKAANVDPVEALRYE